MNMNDGRTQTQGFTLIELMIVVAVIAILAAIAYPSYQSHIIKTRRATAAACVIELAQFMEREYTTNQSYADAVLPNADTGCQNDLNGFYGIAFPSPPTATAFSITATAQGVQANDTQCGNLTINERGTKSVSVSGTDPSACF